MSSTRSEDCRERLLYFPGRVVLLRPQLQIGDRVRLYGGYLEPPPWLEGTPPGRSEYSGAVTGFILGDKGSASAVVELDEEAHVEIDLDETEAPVRADGKFAVLTLRYERARWKTRGTVHVELLQSPPEPRQDRPRGPWVESHATYERI